MYSEYLGETNNQLIINLLESIITLDALRAARV